MIVSSPDLVFTSCDDPTSASTPYVPQSVRSSSKYPENKNILDLKTPQSSGKYFKKYLGVHRRALVTPQSTRSCRSRVTPGALARKDIFYSGSLRNIPLYKASPEAYTQCIISTPKPTIRDIDDHDGDDDKKEPCCSSPKCSGNTENLSSMIDFSLMKDPVFQLIAWSHMLVSLGYCIPYIFLPDRAKLLGQSTDQGAFLVSIIGISNTVGRVVFGFVADRKGVDRLMLYATVLMLGGISTMLQSFCVYYELLCLYAAAIGMFLGKYFSIFYQGTFRLPNI